MNHGPCSPCTCGCKVFGITALVDARGKPWSSHMLTCIRCGKRWIPNGPDLTAAEEWVDMFSAIAPKT